MFSGSGRQPGARKYADRGAVRDALLGDVEAVTVLGLFVSRRTVGLRIQLQGERQPAVWGADDDAPVSGWSRGKSYSVAVIFLNAFTWAIPSHDHSLFQRR